MSQYFSKLLGKTELVNQDWESLNNEKDIYNKRLYIQKIDPQSIEIGISNRSTSKRPRQVGLILI